MLIALSALAGYLVIGYLFHLVIFSEDLPDPRGYFEIGDTIGSEEGGTKFTVLGREGDKLRMKLLFAPGADGPPPHIHTGFDELYAVEEGRIDLRVDGKTHTLGPGDELNIPKGVPHKPSNPYDEPAVIRDATVPEQFMVYLDQVYKFMDEDENNTRTRRMILQMSLMNRYFDSYLAEGPPVFVQKVLNFLLRPLARLLGYRTFYEKYRAHRPAWSTAGESGARVVSSSGPDVGGYGDRRQRQ